jgi:WD40 repeat protein
LKDHKLETVMLRNGLPRPRTENTWQAHRGAIAALKFYEDLCLVVTGSFDGDVRLWRPRGDLLASILAHTEATTALACAGHLLASGSVSGNIQLWDITDLTQPALYRELPGHTGWISAISFSGSGGMLTSASHDGTLRVWDAATGSEIGRFSDDSSPLVSMSADPAVNTIYAGSSRGGLYSLNMRDPVNMKSIIRFSEPISAIAALSQEHATLVGTMSHGIYKISSSGRVLDSSRKRIPSWPTAIFADEERQLAIISSADLVLRVWDVNRMRPSGLLPAAGSSLGPVALAGDGTIFCGNDQGQISQLELGKDEVTVDGHQGSIWSVAIDSADRLVLSASSDGTVRVWEVSSGRHVRTLSGHEGWVNSVAVSADGELALSGSSDGTVRVWEVSSGRHVRTLSGHEGWVNSVAVSADGELALSGSSDGTVRVWEVSSGRQSQMLRGHSLGVTSVHLSADLRSALSAGYDGLVNHWDLSTGAAAPRVLRGHKDRIWAVSGGSSGEIAASASADGTVRLWDVVRGAELETCQLYSPVTACAVMEAGGNGRLIAYGQRNGQVGLMRLTWC